MQCSSMKRHLAMPPSRLAKKEVEAGKLCRPRERAKELILCIVQKETDTWSLFQTQQIEQADRC